MDYRDLNITFETAKDAVDSYRKNGHVLLRNVIDANLVSNFRAVIADGVRQHNLEKRTLEERSTYGKAFLQTTNLWKHSAEIKRFVFARRFAAIAAELMGVESVRLYHDQALFKEPGGGRTPWHQDMYYWPFETINTITMWMPLVDISKETGMLTFASGSHKDGLAAHVGISDDSDLFFGEYVGRKGYESVCADSMSAGDATFHNGFTIHTAPGNNSGGVTREVMTVIYFADGTRVAQPANKSQEIDLEVWLGGREPGDLADSDLNPVL